MSTWKKSISAYESKIKKQRTKAHTKENIQDRGGYPSAYVISGEVMRIRSISEKMGAANYIRERMNEYGLGYDLTKYLMEAFFHAAKMDKRILPLMFGTGARFMNDNLPESDVHKKKRFPRVCGQFQTATSRHLQTRQLVPDRISGLS